MMRDQTHALPAGAGAWRIEAGRVLRLRLREDRMLRAGESCLWLTFERRAAPAGDVSVDHFLQPGERMLVRAGETVVLGASRRRDSASFDWLPAPRPATRRPAAPWRALQDAWSLLAMRALATAA